MCERRILLHGGSRKLAHVTSLRAWDEHPRADGQQEVVPWCAAHDILERHTILHPGLLVPSTRALWAAVTNQAARAARREGRRAEAHLHSFSPRLQQTCQRQAKPHGRLPCPCAPLGHVFLNPPAHIAPFLALHDGVSESVVLNGIVHQPCQFPLHTAIAEFNRRSSCEMGAGIAGPLPTVSTYCEHLVVVSAGHTFKSVCDGASSSANLVSWLIASQRRTVAKSSTRLVLTMAGRSTRGVTGTCTDVACGARAASLRLGAPTCQQTLEPSIPVGICRAPCPRPRNRWEDF